MTALQRLLPKPPAGPLPLALPRRRIYILPSRFGLVYGVALLFLLIGSLNYNNNAAILLSLLLAAAAMASSALNVFFLAGLRISAFQSDEVFAGDGQRCRLRLSARSGGVRGEVLLRHGDAVSISARPDGPGHLLFTWVWPSQRRGRRALGRITLSSGYPLGLFRAWCVLEPTVASVVYPAPESPPVPLPQTDSSRGEQLQTQPGNEEWHSLREFQRGDSPRQIAWKTSARHDRWLVNEMRGGSQLQSLRFSLDQVAGMERERGISRLARWLLMAEVLQRPYALQLGDRIFGPGRGPEQRQRTLTALAELP